MSVWESLPAWVSHPLTLVSVGSVLGGNLRYWLGGWIEKIRFVRRPAAGHAIHQRQRLSGSRFPGGDVSGTTGTRPARNLSAAGHRPLQRLHDVLDLRVGNLQAGARRQLANCPNLHCGERGDWFCGCLAWRDPGPCGVWPILKSTFGKMRPTVSCGPIRNAYPAASSFTAWEPAPAAVQRPMVGWPASLPSLSSLAVAWPVRR